MSKVCVVFGAGAKIGYSVARKYASQGFKVVVSRRSEISAADLKTIGDNVTSIQCDVTNPDHIKSLVDKVEADIGAIHTVIYNAGTGTFKPWQQVTMADMDQGYATNTKGLLLLAQLVAPGMVERGEGVIGVTGATASLRGKPFTAGFAPAKASQRMVAQALARDLGPKGVHVFYVIIDGQINGTTDPKFMQADEIADVYWNIASQPRSVWTHEMDLRPFGENW